jgi:hypothetical protein
MTMIDDHWSNLLVNLELELQSCTARVVPGCKHPRRTLTLSLPLLLLYTPKQVADTTRHQR